MTKPEAKLLGQLLIAASLISFLLWFFLNFYNYDTRMPEWVAIIAAIGLTGVGFLIASLRLPHDSE